MPPMRKTSVSPEDRVKLRELARRALDGAGLEGLVASMKTKLPTVSSHPEQQAAWVCAWFDELLDRLLDARNELVKALAGPTPDEGERDGGG